MCSAAATAPFNGPAMSSARDSSTGKTHGRQNPARSIGWTVSSRPVGYPAAIAQMEARVGAIAAGEAPELIWLLEHPPLYTAGTSAKPADLIAPNRFPVFQTGRGGQFTYHGPGQRVVYVMVDLARRGGDVRAFVQALETWIIATAARFGVEAVVRPGRVGVWVPRSQELATEEPLDDKIAAIGIRVRRSVSFHGLSINVNPDLDHFAGIVPCGIAEHGVASLASLGATADMAAVDAALRQTFVEIFGDVRLIGEKAPA